MNLEKEKQISKNLNGLCSNILTSCITFLLYMNNSGYKYPNSCITADCQLQLFGIKLLISYFFLTGFRYLVELYLWSILDPSEEDKDDDVRDAISSVWTRIGFKENMPEDPVEAIKILGDRFEYVLQDVLSLDDELEVEQ